MIKKKGQGWGFDLVVGMSIFMLGIVAFFLYTLNYNPPSENTLDQMSYDGEIISSSLLSEGYPADWTDTTVVSIGITSQNKINQTKLEQLYNMDYDKSRDLFNTDYNYYFTLSDPNPIIINVINQPGIGRAPVNQKNLIKTTRFTIYNNKPVSLNLYIWN